MFRKLNISIVSKSGEFDGESIKNLIGSDGILKSFR